MRRLRALPSIHNALILILLALAAVAAESFAPEGVDVRLWPLAIVAGLIGISLGLLRAPDSVSHLIAIAGGFAIAISLAAVRLAQEAPASSFRDRVVSVTTDLRDWYIGTGADTDTNDLLIVILLQMIVWLISYLSSWSLIRQGWLFVALLLPGAIVVAARVSGFDQPPYLLEIFLIAAVMLAARVTYLRRVGTRTDSESADRRGWASLLVATVVGVMVVTLGLSTPEDFSSNTIEPVAEYAGDTYLSAQQRTSDWIADNLGLAGSKTPDIDDYPRYTAFDDAFSIGGDLNLSERPEVLVRTEGPAPYLTAQSYDTYTGRGWESTVEDTFDEEGPDGVRYSPELTFRSGQNVPYSPVMRQQRVSVDMEVTPLGPPGDIVFSEGAYVTASERASVRMSWRQLDNTAFPLRQMELASIPPDLTGIASLLIRADDLTVEGDLGLQYPSAGEGRDQLQTMRAQLSDRFIDVSWTVGPDGRVDEMIVTGQVPVYDDNVSIERATDGGPNDPYVVTSLVSGATEDALRQATTEYPEWVSQRYVELPDGVTDRTADLTHELVAGSSNPYDRAKVIESFLRGHITYDLEVGVPDEGVDIVDYVLFELQRGYCEHYASAMTVMLRILGIPAKTVVGYFPGEFDETYGGVVYRQQNAHAWTEAFFPDYGWIRFEPTASRPPSAFGEREQTPAQTPEPTPPPATEAPISSPVPPTAEVPEDAALIADAVPQTPADGDGGHNWPLLIGVPIAIAGVAAAVVWLLVARPPVLDPRALFGSMVRWGRAGGVPADGSSTPREYARSVGRRFPDLAGDADRIVDVYEDQRYGGRPPERSRLHQAADAVRHLQRAVIRRLVRLGR